MATCISRIAELKTVQRFGDGKRRFFLEYRCNNPCMPDSDICEKCIVKEDNYPNPHLRRFNHGKVNEPIPDNSHIYGGKWYFDGVKKWGAPSYDIVEFALQCQEEARKGFVVDDVVYEKDETSKEEQINTNKKMPRAKKAVTNDEGNKAEDTSDVPVKKTRRTKAVKKVEDGQEQDHTKVLEQSQVSTEIKEEIVLPKPKTRTKSSTVDGAVPKKRVAARRKESLTNRPPNELNILPKESCCVMPTLIENTFDEYDTTDFDVVYVHVELFEVNGTQYIRDPNKNKLYKKLKDNKIGEYIGRYNSETSEIEYEVPDSDSE